MLFAVTPVPAAVIILGTIAGIVGVVLFVQDRSEIGSKWAGLGLGLLAVGIVLSKIV